MTIESKERERSLVALSADLARYPAAQQRAFAQCVLSRCDYEIADPVHLLTELADAGSAAPRRRA